MKLVFGVNDIPYSTRPLGPRRVPKAMRRRRPVKAPKVAAGTQTTGDVAGWLESRYHVMETFVEIHAPEILESLETSMAGDLENRLMGAPTSGDPFVAAYSDIEAMFRSFLDNDEMASAGIEGVPTKAAQRGVNHRLLHPYAIRAPRPSFIDTGQYQANVRVWSEN